MRDSNAAPPLPSSPSPLPRRSLWAWVKPLFTAHSILALATLALVITAIVQHFDTVDAVEATKRLAIANENAANDRRQTASAELMLRIDAMLDDHRYDRIVEDIQNHVSNYHLPKYKSRSDADVEEYIWQIRPYGIFC
jgi:hypothetical protein